MSIKCYLFYNIYSTYSSLSFDLQSTFINRPALGILPPENFTEKLKESLLSVCLRKNNDVPYSQSSDSLKFMCGLTLFPLATNKGRIWSSCCPRKWYFLTYILMLELFHIYYKQPSGWILSCFNAMEGAQEIAQSKMFHAVRLLTCPKVKQAPKRTHIFEHYNVQLEIEATTEGGFRKGLGH